MRSYIRAHPCARFCSVGTESDREGLHRYALAPDAVDVEDHWVHLADVECCAMPGSCSAPTAVGSERAGRTTPTLVHSARTAGRASAAVNVRTPVRHAHQVLPGRPGRTRLIAGLPTPAGDYRIQTGPDQLGQGPDLSNMSYSGAAGVKSPWNARRMTETDSQ